VYSENITTCQFVLFQVKGVQHAVILYIASILELFELFVFFYTICGSAVIVFVDVKPGSG
jgi:hypothetical protein